MGDTTTLQNVTTAMLALAWVAVILRVYVRVGLVKAFGADDWLAVATLVSRILLLRYILSITKPVVGNFHSILQLCFLRSHVPHRHGY
jgi:hypothetical protein